MTAPNGARSFFNEAELKIEYGGLSQVCQSADDWDVTSGRAPCRLDGSLA